MVETGQYREQLSPREDWVRACGELAHAWGPPRTRALLKHCPEDFEVEEVLGFEPDGVGEHLYLFIEKSALTTPELQRQLARHYRCHPRDVAYAGLKDRQALTRQWFSVRLPGLADGPEPPSQAQWRVLRALRNSRKLKRGSHRGNRFRLRLRDFDGDRAWLEERIALVAASGVPNYFGPQRFGRDCGNLLQVLDWFAGGEAPAGRERRGMLLSAARAFLFNRLLSSRIEAGSWTRALDGELLALDGSGRCFAAERESPAALESRLRQLDLHPSGVLWGRSSSAAPRADSEAGALERTLARRYPLLCGGLERAGLDADRRALRLRVREISAGFEDNALLLEFTLDSGAYATTVLRELTETETR